MSGSQFELKRRLLPGYLKYTGEVSTIAGTVYAQWSEEQVWCPHCGTLYSLDACDGDGDLVTYYGEGLPVAKTCSSCGKLFYVKERVSRTYTAGMTPEEAMEL